MHQPAGSIVDVDGGGWYAMGARWIGPNTQKGSTIRRNATPIMRGAGYGQAVTLRRGCFAHVSGKAGSRATVRTMRTRILKSKAPDCSGAFALEGTIHPRKNVNTCRRVSDQHRSRCRDQRCLDPMDSPRRLRWHRCACSTL